MSVDPLPRLRRLCMSHPEATERPSHGEPTWFVGTGKSFVTYADHHHDDRPAFWRAAPSGAREALVGSGPERFFVPPYVGGRVWLGVRLGVRLGVPVDWGEVALIVSDAYRTVAPRRFVEAIEAGPP